MRKIIVLSQVLLEFKAKQTHTMLKGITGSLISDK